MYNVEVRDDQIHLRLPNVTKNELERLRMFTNQDQPVAVHVPEQPVFYTNDLHWTAPHRYDCPHLIWKTPNGYVSPYAVAAVGKRSLKGWHLFQKYGGCSYMDLLDRASSAVFRSTQSLDEEVAVMQTLGKFVLSFEKFGDAGMIVDDYIVLSEERFVQKRLPKKKRKELQRNNLYDRVIQEPQKRNIRRDLRNTLLHELDHAVEKRMGLGCRSGFAYEHIAEYFALRAPFEARELVAKYRPAIDFMLANNHQHSAFEFDTSTGAISILKNPPESPLVETDDERTESFLDGTGFEEWLTLDDRIGLIERITGKMFT